jgi:hypothetical protein
MTPPLWILAVFFALLLLMRHRSAYMLLGKSRFETWGQWWDRIGK